MVMNNCQNSGIEMMKLVDLRKKIFLILMVYLNHELNVQHIQVLDSKKNYIPWCSRNGGAYSSLFVYDRYIYFLVNNKHPFFSQTSYICLQMPQKLQKV